MLVSRLNRIYAPEASGGSIGCAIGLVFWHVSVAVLTSRAWLVALGLAVLGYWTLGVFPLIKYPASPPALGPLRVSDFAKESMEGFSSYQYFGAVLMAAVYRYIGHIKSLRPSQTTRWTIIGLLCRLYATLIYVALPNNPDPVPLFASFITTFRRSSIGG